jgi:hypothetical protein
MSAGLAWAYAAAALGWLALTWRDARAGLFFIAGALLAPLSLLGLLPLAATTVRGQVARAAQVFAAVLVAAVVAGMRGDHLPFSGSPPPLLELNRTRDPFTAAGALWHTLAAQQVLLLEAIVLAAAAVALPRVTRRWIPAFGLLLLAGLLAPDPALPDVAVVTTAFVSCLGLAVKTSRPWRVAEGVEDEWTVREHGLSAGTLSAARDDAEVGSAGRERCRPGA